MKDKSRDHESFLILKDHEKYVRKLNNEEAGKLFIALFAYADRKEVPDFYHEDNGSRLSMTYDILTDTMDVNEKKYAAIVEKRKEAGRKGGIESGKSRKERSKRSKCLDGEANEADIETDNVNVSGTDTGRGSETDIDIETDSEDKSSASAGPDPPGPSLEGGPAPGADLFTYSQLLQKCRAGNVDLTEEGIRIFLEDMKADKWTMYGKPVEKRFILRALREWANKHTEYTAVKQIPSSNKAKPQEQDNKAVPILKTKGMAPGWDDNCCIFDSYIPIVENVDFWNDLYPHGQEYSETQISQIAYSYAKRYSNGFRPDAAYAYPFSQLIRDQIEWEIKCIINAYTESDINQKELHNSNLMTLLRERLSYLPKASFSKLHLSYIEENYQKEIPDAPMRKNENALCWKDDYKSFFNSEPGKCVNDTYLYLED